MKVNKILLSAAAFAAGALLSAQTVSFHGYMDYTNFAVGQENQNLTDSSTKWTEPSAEYGSFYNGRTELNMNVSAANFLFNIGIRLDSSGNSWYSLYHDVTQTVTTYDASGAGTAGYAATPFHQMNMRVSFWNDQIFFYTGKFEEWNAGYVFNGYALGGQPVLEIASRDAGQHMTALEFCPQFVNGLKVFAGVPILPVSGNGLQYTTTNQWKNLYKKVKFAAQYKLPIGITFNALYRPGTYYTGIYKYDTADGATTNYYSEGTLQADMPYLVPGVPLNATFDIRYRHNDIADKEAFLYSLGISGQVKPISNLTVNFENRFAYADDHYIAMNEKLMYDILGADVIYSFAGTPYQVGASVRGIYAQDANGSVYASGGQQNDKTRCEYNMTIDWFDAANAPTSGSAGRYITVYGYPYVQKNFANGYARLGVEIEYSHFQTSNTTEGLAYRVPFATCFWF
jgi:hypothetical protein